MEVTGKRVRRTAIGVIAAVMGIAFLAPAAGAAVFSNPAPLQFPTSNTDGKANLYPSPINVTGLTGAVTNVTVTITGLSHTFPRDIDILLVGPSGQNVVLLADQGGGTDISNVNLTFDQAAQAQVPNPIVSGTFQPTNNGTFSGPAPAPPAPHGASLAIFNGTVPNGTWNLFVFDDVPATDNGTIAGGWSLDITTNGPTISGFTPQTGPAGTQVVITGTNFTGATAVRFGGFPATTFTVNSATQITATVPPNAPSGPISVTTPNGTANSTTDYQVSPPPTVTSFTPTAGRVGRQVVITGTNFTGATAVRFGDTPATAFTVNSATQITATVPTGAGAGPISVTTPGGQGASSTPFVVGHRRSISLSLTRTRARGTLTAADGFTKCAAGVEVELQRRSRGRWREVGSDVTSASGDYSVASRRKGRYRAVARRTTLTSGDTCARAKSGKVRRARSSR